MVFLTFIYIHDKGEVREEVVYVTEVGVRAGWGVQKPACEVDLVVFIHCKVRCDFEVVPGRAGQVEVHDQGLEPRYELAVDPMYNGLRFILVVEPSVPVATIAAAPWPGVAVVCPGEVLLQPQVVVLQPEDLEPERVALLPERLVLAAELEQARVEEHLAYGGESFDALHDGWEDVSILPPIKNNKHGTKKNKTS